MGEAAPQRSEAWRLDRAGKITASCFGAAIEFTPGEGVYKSGPRKGQPRPDVSSAERRKLMRVLAFERLSGKPVHEIGGRALAWGEDVEAFADEAYQVETGLVVVPSEFIVHPLYPFIGCSPDGLVGTDGGIEKKCPHDEAVHIGTWIDGMPEDHMPQVQGCMFVTGRRWWDFISYDPRQAEKLRLYVQRIERDDAYIKTLEAGLLQFERELQSLIRDLTAKAA